MDRSVELVPNHQQADFVFLNKMKHLFWGKKDFGHWWVSEIVEKMKSRHCEIASRRTTGWGLCRLLKCHVGEECFGCVMHIVLSQAVAGNMWKGVISNQLGPRTTSGVNEELYKLPPLSWSPPLPWGEFLLSSLNIQFLFNLICSEQSIYDAKLIWNLGGSWGEWPSW